MKYPTFFVHLSGFIIHGRKLTINVMNFVIDNNFLQNTLFVHLLFKIDIVYFAVVKFCVQEESYDIFSPSRVTTLSVGVCCLR